MIARGPLASGLLTGEITKYTKFPDNDHRNYNIKGDAFDIGDTFSGVNLDKGFKAINLLKKILPKNFSLADLALKWILSYDAVTVVIPGATDKKHVKKNCRASDLDDISEIIQKLKRFMKNSLNKMFTKNGKNFFMRYENLGNSDLNVSKICLGTMTLESRSLRVCL